MLSESQKAARQAAVEFARTALDGTQDVESFDRDGWDKCAAFGAMGVTAPVEYGGRGQTLNEFVAMMEGFGYASRRQGILFAINAHVFGAVEAIRASSNDDQKRRLLAPVAKGEWVTSHCITEPEGGSDVNALTTRAEEQPDGWVINGTKTYITCGAVADAHVVYARTAGGGQSHLCCFVVVPETKGVTCTPLDPVGLKGCGLGTIAFENAFVPNENMLGKPSSGSMMFQGAIERERACIWGSVLGAMDREFEMAVQHANSRKIGGKAIAAHQAVSHRIADMKLRIELARMLLYRTTALKAEGRRAPAEAAMTKLYLSETYVQNSLDLMRIFGAGGYVREGGVEQFVRDALGGVLYSGTSDIQRNIIAASIGLQM